MMCSSMKVRVIYRNGVGEWSKVISRPCKPMVWWWANDVWNQFQFPGCKKPTSIPDKPSEHSHNTTTCYTHTLYQSQFQNILYYLFNVTTPDVFFEINGNIYLNNSDLPLSEVGECENALYCNTDKEDCCGNPPNRVGNSTIPIEYKSQLLGNSKVSIVTEVNRL